MANLNSFTDWATQDGVFTYTTEISGSSGPGISQSLQILLLFLWSWWLVFLERAQLPLNQILRRIFCLCRDSQELHCTLLEKEVPESVSRGGLR